jgi:hypothetical protein
MESASTPSPAPPAPGKPEKDLGPRLRRLLLAIPLPDFPPPRISGPRLVLVLAVLLLLLTGYRFLRGSFREVEPGYAGVAVNRFTGNLETLPPGTHWRPPSLYDLHAVRISDQILSGPASTFSVSTREGVTAQLIEA